MQSGRVIEAGAEGDKSIGSKHFAYLGAVERRNQFIRGTKLPTFQRGGDDRVHRVELLGGISPPIGLGCLDIRMPEPQRDLADIPGGLQHHHRRRVSQDMR